MCRVVNSHHLARQDVGGGGPLEALLHVLVVGREQALAGLDQEVDDLGRGHVEQRRHLAARVNGLVEIEPGGRERDPQVARAVGLLGALDQAAAIEERGGNDRLGRNFRRAWIRQGAHDTPLT